MSNKSPDVKIVQIVATRPEDANSFGRIYGLGSDERIYLWNHFDHTWSLWG